MTREDEFIAQLEGYLDEYVGSTPLPDDVRDAIRAELPSIQQRKAWWPARRFPPMNQAMRIALASAAVLAVALIGVSFFRAQNVGAPGLGDATPTPAPSAMPLPASGALEPGRYAMDVISAPLSASVTVGDGWTSGLWYITNSDGGSVHSLAIANVYTDACDGPGNLAAPAIGPSIDDLVAALDAQAGTDLSVPTDAVVDGYEGVRVELTPAEGIDPTACTGGSLFLWVDSLTDRRYVGDEQALWILDVDGTRVVIAAGYDLADPAQEAALATVIDTFRFSSP